VAYSRDDDRSARFEVDLQGNRGTAAHGKNKNARKSRLSHNSRHSRDSEISILGDQAFGQPRSVEHSNRYSTVQKLSVSQYISSTDDEEYKHRMTLKACVAHQDHNNSPKQKQYSRSDYKGRLRRWPGVLLMLFIIVGSIVAIVFCVLGAYKAAQARRTLGLKRLAIARGIKDGSLTLEVDEDGIVNNPMSYAKKGTLTEFMNIYIYIRPFF
jgi:hypothetical protein